MMKIRSLLLFAPIFLMTLLGTLWGTLLGTLLGVSTAQAAPQAKQVFKSSGVVWGFAFLSPNEMLITLRHGRLIYFDHAKNIQRELVLPDNVVATGQGGLLDIAVHSTEMQDAGGKYRDKGNNKTQGNRYVYVTYSTRHREDHREESKGAPQGGMLTTALARGLWDEQSKSIAHFETLFIAKTAGNSGRHFGSRLYITDKHIYMTIGDRGARKYAQSLFYHNGKVLRLTLQGEAAQGTKQDTLQHTKQALPEIWSYGHRNPQGLDYDHRTNRLYSIEFGPRGGDELNLIEQGKNYGWPLITYGREYSGPVIGPTHRPGMEQPIIHWTPSISPSGMAFYSSNKIPHKIPHKIPQWRNHLFVAALGNRHLRRLVITDNKVVHQEVLFEALRERVRQVRSGLDGYLYFSTDSGKIYKVTP